MKLTFTNLGAISKGSLEIEKGTLNVKYGSNGTGKSTISKALELYIKNESIESLRTFGQEKSPTFMMDETVDNLLVFNQDYVDKHLFKEDIAHNSFEIMINTEEYKIARQRIDHMFEELVRNAQNKDIEKIILELDTLIKNVSVDRKETKTKGIQYNISKKSIFMKAKKVGNLDEKLDDKAVKYKDLLKSENNHEWIKWFEAGQSFIQEHRQCPFCLKDLPDDFAETSQSIKNTVNVTELKDNLKMRKTVNDVDKYMSKDTRETLHQMTNKMEDLSDAEKKELYEIIQICSTELLKLKNLYHLNVSEIKKKYEEKTLTEYMENNKLFKSFYQNSDKTIKDIVKNINQSIDKIILKADELNDFTKEFSDKLNSLVTAKKDDVNTFLRISGIPYEIDILENGVDNYKTVLYPRNLKEKVSDKHLSYGEKNAISLVLFSLEASNGYDFIVLDDPISSFDHNKKFALLYYLFAKDNAVLKDKTVLMFTHDFNVIVDFIYKNKISNMKPKCYFVKNNKGSLEEKIINTKGVKYTLRLWKENAENVQKHPLLRIVNLRKYLQYAKRDEKVAMDILSSLEHDDSKVYKKENQKKVPYLENDEKLIAATNLIKKYIKDFDYQIYREKLHNKEELKKLYDNTTISIEKLQILRMLVNLTKREVPNEVFFDYLTEYYHVENNEMMSLMESKYDVIPSYIMIMADNLVQDLFK